MLIFKSTAFLRVLLLPFITVNLLHNNASQIRKHKAILKKYIYDREFALGRKRMCLYMSEMFELEQLR